jgi:hypothetical protein
MRFSVKFFASRAGAFSFLLLGACTGHDAPAHAAAMTNTIVITNGGSTNMIGYRITIGASGNTSYVTGSGTGNRTLPADMLAKLNHDLGVAGSLAALPQGACMKSASFGTSSFIGVGADRSPDLSCPGNPAGQALKDDMDAIVSFLHVDTVPRSQGHDLPPQNF